MPVLIPGNENAAPTGIGSGAYQISEINTAEYSAPDSDDQDGSAE